MESNDLKLAAGVILGSLLIIVGVVFIANLTDKPDVVNVVDAIGENRPEKGNSASGISIVEFSDFQCPACAVAFSSVGEFLKTYGDQVHFVYRHFPITELHPNAMPAAYASEAAGKQGKFWEVHDWLFTNQSAWETAAVDADYLFEQFGEEISLDRDQFSNDYLSDEVRNAVSNDHAEARNLGVSSTPTFFINGKKIAGALSLQSLIDASGVIIDANNANDGVTPEPTVAIEPTVSGE